MARVLKGEAMKLFQTHRISNHSHGVEDSEFSVRGGLDWMFSMDQHKVFNTMIYTYILY